MSAAVPPIAAASMSNAAAAATAAAIVAGTSATHPEPLIPAPATSQKANGSSATNTTAPTSNATDGNNNSKKALPPPIERTDSGDDSVKMGAKRPLNRVGKNGEPLSEKKLRRLEKNRLSARECRRRKREATEDLQRQINLLEGENLRLRLQLQVGEEAEVSSQQEQQKLTESLDDLLRSGASESEIYAKIEEYKEKFADYGRDRRSAMEFHLRNVERLLQPTQTTSVVLTTLHMGQNLDRPPGGGKTDIAATPSASIITPESIPSDLAAPPPATATAASSIPAAATAGVGSAAAPLAAAATSGLDMKSLFRHLVNILEVTPEQAAALKDSRMVAKEMDECLKASLDVLKELRARLTQCGEGLEQEFNNIRSILTPTQAAKFLVWVANNKACMHMLNELWNKVYPQMGGGDNGDLTP